MRRSHHLVVLTLAGLFAISAAADMQAMIVKGPKAAKGKRVLLRDDGSWEYVGAPTPRSTRLRDELKAGQAWGEHGDQPGQFATPAGIAVDDAGSIYVADKNNHRIQKFDANRQFEREWTVRIQPTSLAFGPNKALYATTTNLEPVIHVFDTSGEEVGGWGTIGTADGQFSSATEGLAIDGDGNVYVADIFNHRIQKFDADGRFLTKWGTLGTGDGEFNQPFNVAVDASGSVYVTDSENFRIQKFSADGNFLAAWGGKGGDDGQFWNKPNALLVDAAGTVWVTATGGGVTQIQRFDASGKFLMGWGHRDNGESFGIDFVHHGLVVLPSGQVYVADSGNSRILNFRLSHSATTGSPAGF